MGQIFHFLPQCHHGTAGSHLRFAWTHGLLLLSLAFLAGCSITSKEFQFEHDVEGISFHDQFLKESATASADQPNILLILADDLGKTDISHYGSPHLQTPHIDGIGQRGVTFQEGYISSPICAPSRAGLLTGRYQQRFGFEFQPHARYPRNKLEYFVYKKFIARDDWRVSEQKTFPKSEAIINQGLPPTEFTLAELLKKQGYATGIVGKWHLGTEEHAWPNKRGFDEQFGFYEAYSLYHPDTASPDIINQRHGDFSDKWIWGGGRKGNCCIRRNHKPVLDSVYLTHRIAEEAVRFIDAHQAEPFFLYVPFSAPHTPFQVTREYFDRFAHVKDRNKRIYYGMIAAMDDAIGDILASLEERGLRENTLVIFLSDNGGATYTHATDNAPLKGGKFTNFEGGLNVPFLMEWPGTLPAGKAVAAPVIAMDIFQTVAARCAVDLPEDREYDGIDLLSRISGEVAWPDRALYWRSLYSWAIRKGPWKLIVDEKSGSRVLYNLEVDKEELHNLAGTSPDIVKMLEAEWQAWELKTIPPLWPRVMDYRFETEDGVFHFPL